MTKRIFLGLEDDLEVAVRRSRRSKRLSLRVSSLDGRVTLTTPYGVTESTLRTFVLEKENWLRAHLNTIEQPIIVKSGQSIPYLGHMRDITRYTGSGIKVNTGIIYIPHTVKNIGPYIAGFLKTQAHSILVESSEHYSEKLGIPYNTLRLRDTRSRWGSCSSNKGLMFSWRLIMAPKEVLDYVVAHEVAHLSEMNHSNAFWKLVHNLYGDYEQPRTWLIENGRNLHKYQFSI